MSLLGGKLLRPHGQRSNRRGSYSQFADAGEQLENESFQFALQVEMPGFVIEPHCADGDDQYCSD